MPLDPVTILLGGGAEPPPRLRDLDSRTRALEMYTSAFSERSLELVRDLQSGTITIDQWQMEMRNELRYLHSAAVVIARGGEYGLVTKADWGRMGRYLRDQYAYLYRYAQAIQANAANALAGTSKPYSEKYLAYRSSLYGGNAKATLYRTLAQGLLSQVPGDGQTQCRTNCKCYLVFENSDIPGVLLVFWRMSVAEHCDDCVVLEATWNPLELVLPIGMSGFDYAVDWVLYCRRIPVVA